MNNLKIEVFWGHNYNDNFSRLNETLFKVFRKIRPENPEALTTYIPEIVEAVKCLTKTDSLFDQP